MDASDWIAVIALFVSVVSASASIYAVVCSTKLGRHSNHLSQGGLMTALRSQISSAKSNCHTIGIQQSSPAFKELDPNQKAIIQAAWKSSIEDFINQYECACNHYLNQRIDRSEFKAEYRREIETICNPKNTSFANLMYPEQQCSYRSIWKVYCEWFGPPPQNTHGRDSEANS